jgi:hypothetical protein
VDRAAITGWHFSAIAKYLAGAASTMSTVPSKVEWADVLNESVHPSDDVDIGDIDAFSRDLVVVKVES